MPIASSDIRNWVIYKMVNPENQVYIGRSTNLKERLANYNGLYGRTERQPLLYASLLKHGFQNHKVSILDSFESGRAYAEGKEIFWIRSFMSNINQWPEQNGLNKTIGGQGNIGYVVSEENKKKFGDRLRGIPLTDETKKKLSIKGKERDTKYWLGKKMSSEAKAKMSASKKGKPNLFLKGKPLSEEQKEALRPFQFKKGHIPAHTGKILWDKENRERIGRSKIGNTYTKGMKMTDEQKEKMRLAKLKKSIPVIQYDLNGNFIKEYSGKRQAAKESGVSRHCLNQIINGTTKNPKIFIFKYKQL